MKTTVISVFLAVTAAVPAMASKQSPVKATRLKGSGKIVISNDAKSVKATQTVGKKKKTLVEVRSQRKKPAATVSKNQKTHKTQKAGKPNVPASLANIFDEAADRYRLDPLLLAAVARQESRFRTRAVSPVGAQGVMQLMPRTAKALGVKDAFDPRQNIFGGAKYLRQLLNQFSGDVDLSLAAYNAGPGAVRKYRGIPPYRETRNYVASIRRDYDAARLQ